MGLSRRVAEPVYWTGQAAWMVQGDVAAVVGCKHEVLGYGLVEIAADEGVDCTACA